MRKLYIITSLLFLIPSFNFAQANFACGMSPLTQEERRFIAEEIATTALHRNDEMHCIPVQPFIFTNNNGTESLSEVELNTGLSYLNFHFKNAGIQFYWAGTPVFIQNEDLFDFNMTDSDINGADTENDLVALAGQSTTAVNLYFIHSITKPNGNAVDGYAYYPGNSPVSNRIFVTTNAVTGADNGTMVHEFGHYFGLLHTHEGTSEGCENVHAENVSREAPYNNCFTEGDLICDTEADPMFIPGSFDYATCSYEGSSTDRYGLHYNPMVGNIMSYFPDNCGGYFTQGQFERIQQGLEVRLAATFYKLENNSGTQQAPSILNATYDQVSNCIKLSWTSVTENNTGFLVERSSDLEPNFEVMPGAVTNFLSTEFQDTHVEEGLTYNYRLKPTNGSCYVYSGTASVTIANEICTPKTTGEIGSNYIDMFRIKENTQILMIKNSAYQYSGYSNYTNETVSVKQGANLQCLARIHKTNNNYVPQNIAIWLDVNGDRDFNDAGELLFMSSGTAATELMTGMIQIPANISTGVHRLRLRSRYAPDSPSNPCSDYESGETEDYMLNIIAAPENQASTSPENNQPVLNNPNNGPSDKNYKIYPNPVLNSTVFEYQSAFNQDGLISVTDINGFVLFENKVNLTEGKNEITLDMDNFSEGMYYISLITSDQYNSIPVFKKNDD